MNFSNTNIIHNGSPSSNLTMVGTPYGFLIQVDGYKYLFDPVTKTKTIVNNIPFSLAKVEGLPTFANYNDSYLFLLEETTRKVYSAFFLDDNGGKKDFNSLVFTVIEPPTAGLRVASLAAFHSSVTDHSLTNNGLAVIYEYDEISRYSALKDKYPNFISTGSMKPPTDFTYNFLEGGIFLDNSEKTYLHKVLVLPPDIMYNPTNKYLNNIPLSYPLYDISETSPFSKVELFIKDNNSTYIDSNYTSNTYSDISFSLGVGKTLLIKHNGEMLYSNFLENKINSWTLGGSETPIHVKGVKLINDVIIHVTVQSGNNFLYKFSPLDTNPILLARLNSGINLDLSDKVTYSRYFSPTNNNYENFMALLTVNNGNVEIRTTEILSTSLITLGVDSNEVTYRFFNDYLYYKDTKADMSANRTFTLVPNLVSNPTLNDDIVLKNDVLSVIFKSILDLATINYINKKTVEDALYIHTRDFDESKPELGKVSKSYANKITGNLTSSELQLELEPTYYDENGFIATSVPSGITVVFSGFVPTESTMFHISGPNFFYGVSTEPVESFTYAIIAKDINLVLNKIAELANTRNVSIKLSYYDSNLGTTREWGSANVQISETT